MLYQSIDQIDVHNLINVLPAHGEEQNRTEQ